MKIKLTMLVTDPKHGEYRVDLMGMLVFLLALFVSPLVWFIYGFTFASIIVTLVGVVGFVHFWASFFLTIWPFIKIDMAENDRNRKDAD